MVGSGPCGASAKLPASTAGQLAPRIPPSPPSLPSLPSRTDASPASPSIAGPSLCEPESCRLESSAPRPESAVDALPPDEDPHAAATPKAGTTESATSEGRSRRIGDPLRRRETYHEDARMLPRNATNLALLATVT